MDEVRREYEEMQLYRVSYALKSTGYNEFYHGYVFAASEDNVRGILNKHHEDEVKEFFRCDQIISPLPIPTEERFVPSNEVKEIYY